MADYQNEEQWRHLYRVGYGQARQKGLNDQDAHDFAMKFAINLLGQANSHLDLPAWIRRCVHNDLYDFLQSHLHRLAREQSLDAAKTTASGLYLPDGPTPETQLQRDHHARHQLISPRPGCRPQRERHQIQLFLSQKRLSSADQHHRCQRLGTADVQPGQRWNGKPDVRLRPLQPQRLLSCRRVRHPQCSPRLSAVAAGSRPGFSSGHYRYQQSAEPLGLWLFELLQPRRQ